MAQLASQPCNICTHPDRYTIEQHVIDGKKTYAQIADMYEIDEKELRKHCRLHFRAEELSADSSVLSQIKAREFILLQDAALSYYFTLKSLEKVIHKNLAQNNTRAVTKSVVDLYLGSGAEMRQQINTMFDGMQIVLGDDFSSDVPDDGFEQALMGTAEGAWEQ